MDSIELLAASLDEKGVFCERGVLLEGLCTFRIGGPAALLAEPAGTEQLAFALVRARELGVRVMLLGRGANVLFSDRGFDGAVIRLGGRMSAIRDIDGESFFCESGLALSELCEYACKRGLSGLEFAYGIPGTVGGAVYMNAGAYGGEMKDVLLGTRHLYWMGEALLEGEYMGEEMGLSYRRSAYSGADMAITGAVFRLAPGERTGIQSKMEDYISRRRSSQPLSQPSAGSTFRRPKGGYASALIDSCGLKGRRVGGAMVSEKHAGFVVNAGGATAADVKELIEVIKAEVLEKTGYSLECEVEIID